MGFRFRISATVSEDEDQTVEKMVTDRLTADFRCGGAFDLDLLGTSVEDIFDGHPGAGIR